jgi:hypothetical protein
MNNDKSDDPYQMDQNKKSDYSRIKHNHAYSQDMSK